MVIEQISLSTADGKTQQLGKALASLVGRIQVQRGCLSCRLFQEWPTKDDLQMEARWSCEGDLIRHLQSDIFKQVILLVELSAAPPVFEFFIVTEFRGLDLVETARSFPS